MEVSEINAADLASLTAQGYTEQDLSMLAKTEVDSLLAVPSDDDNKGGGDHDRALAEQEEGAAPPPAAPAAAQPATDAAPEPAIQQYKVDVPADAKAQISTLKAEEAAAFKRLMDGEIDADEYKSVKDRVEDAVDDLKTKSITAHVFEQTNQQNAENAARDQWQTAERASMASFQAEGIDYKAPGKESLLAAYNFNLKTLGADAKNERRDAPWFLAEAHRLTKEALGLVAVRKNIPAQRTNGVDPGELPPTLRSVPIAATNAVGSDEFAHMRNLDGLELERAHARLTNEQRDRYMAE